MSELSRKMRQLIESSLESPWYRLSLPDPLETRYRQETGSPAGWYLQSWLMVLIAFNFVSTWVDIDAFGIEAIAIPFGLTVGVYVPVALLSILLCRGQPSQNRQSIVAAVNAILDMAIILNSARMVPPAKADAYLILAALVPFAVGTILTIPFRHGVAFLGASLALYGLAVLTPPLSDRFQNGIPLLCAGLILLPLKMSFSREKESKRTFLFSLLGRIQAEELRVANQRLTVLSGTDPLTGLCNRRAFSDGLEDAWLKAQSVGSWLGVVLIDIDRFKLFNDTGGHAEGDRCLVDVSSAMSKVVAEDGGVMGRYGGEEFAAYLPGATPEYAIEIGDRLLNAVRGLAIVHRGLAGGRTVSVSVGITAAHGAEAAHGVTIQRLLATADAALYAAKRAGRDRAVGQAVTPSYERRAASIEMPPEVELADV